MEISLLKVLLSNISSFLWLLCDDNIHHEPAQKYYRIIEEILNLLKPVLNAAFDSGVAFSDPLQTAPKELSRSVDELRDLFENWHPLRSKIYFILEVETFISKVRDFCIEVLEFLNLLVKISLLSSMHQQLSFMFRKLGVCVLNKHQLL